MYDKNNQQKNIPPEANKNLILFHIQKKEINKFENTLKIILSNFQKIEEKDKNSLIPDIRSEIRKLIDEYKIKFLRILLKYLKDFNIINEEYFHIGIELCELYSDNKNYDEVINLLNILINDANNYEDKTIIENIIQQLNDMMTNILKIKDDLSSKEMKNQKVNNSKKNKKKNKKNKFKEFNYKIEEYDEEKEKEEKNEILKLLKDTFSLTDNEMEVLLNYYFEDDDLDDIDKLFEILLTKYYKQEFKDDEEDEDDKDIDESKEKIEEKNELDINKRSNLRDLLFSIKCEKKLNENSIHSYNEDKKPNNKRKKLSNFDLKKTKEFLEENGNSKTIDLHGCTLAQSLYIVEKKIESLKDLMFYDNLKEITLTIITGIGNHSPEHKAVLKPKVTEWLRIIKRNKKYKLISKSTEGHITVTIY